ncbi:MAG: hypothetical protein B7X99_01290 [Rhizobiales bacterium 17-65-6]|nr:MAG: hypothetical protein B7X99_01290 [Rhizobiales bacterium 17-65-6]
MHHHEGNQHDAEDGRDHEGDTADDISEHRVSRFAPTVRALAGGVNRPDVGGRTAPSAMNSQEVELHVALPHGLFRYEPLTHSLQLKAASDVRRVTGYQDFVDTAPLDLLYVANHAQMKLVPAAQRERYAYAAAGAMSQNVYLYCAANTLATVIRAWFDPRALSQAMGLEADQQLLLCQTVGRVKAAAVH